MKLQAEVRQEKLKLYEVEAVPCMIKYAYHERARDTSAGWINPSTRCCLTLNLFKCVNDTSNKLLPVSDLVINW